MENEEGIERLFFELASESRLGLLRKLSEKNWRMKEVARKLDLTTTETFRQLQRLSEALLVQKHPEGTYAITQYGRLVLQLSSSLEFISKHKEYFSMHDIWRLPAQFVNRIGELSQVTLIMDAMKGMRITEKMFREAEQCTWGMREGSTVEAMVPVFQEQIRKGVKFRDIFPENDFPAYKTWSEKVRNVEGRGFPASDIPAVIMLTEKEAMICLRLNEGRMDYNASFYGNDPASLNWVKDLFLYYWDKGKRA
ncbi:MAG: helix-turn-helix transcriptional regulator [Candidatus Bathyarchaeia archaeon]